MTDIRVNSFSTIRCSKVCIVCTFLPHDAKLARYMLSVCVRLSVRHTHQTLHRNDWMNRAWHESFLPPILLCYEDIQVDPKIRALPPDLCRKLWTEKISPRQVDRVVNKTRRRSSLLTTLTTIIAAPSLVAVVGRFTCISSACTLLLHVRRP